MNRVLITGAAGFTGPYMAEALKEQGFYVIGSSMTGTELPACFDESVALDLRDESRAVEVFEQARPDYIVHLAGISFVGHADLSAFYEINVLGLEHLLSALIQTKSQVKNILVASSANIYGAPEGLAAISEEVVPAPVNHYAISKLAMEFVAKKFMSKLPITIARPFNYIGYGQSLSFVVSKIVDAYARGEASIELGSTHVRRDFSSVYDTVNAYARLLLQTDCAGSEFNVCTGKAKSIDDILAHMNALAGYEMEVKTNPQFVRKHEIVSLCGSNQRIQSFTGWKPLVTLNDALSEMYTRYGAQ